MNKVGGIGGRGISALRVFFLIGTWWFEGQTKSKERLNPLILPPPHPS
jgi:hypothetical protein